MEDIVIIEAKDYSQVVFEDVQESYPVMTQLECLFTLNNYLNIDENDFIGIYKVGFKLTNEYLTCVPINKKNVINNDKAKVVFDCDQIPKEDGEFYQFVYVSQDKVKGASTPFQFKQFKVNKPEDAEIEVVKSKEDEIPTVTCCPENNEVMPELISWKIDENNSNMLLKDSLVGAIQENMEKLKLLENNCNDNKSDTTCSIQEIGKIDPTIEENFNLMANELTMLNEKLAASEQCKALLRKQLGLVTNELEVAKLKSKIDAEKINELITNENSLVNENKRLLDQLNKIKCDYDERLGQVNGAYYALSVSHGCLESRLKTLEEKYEKEIKEKSHEIELMELNDKNVSEGLKQINAQIAIINETLSEQLLKFNETKLKFDKLMGKSTKIENDFDLLQDEIVSKKPTITSSDSSEEKFLLDSYIQSSLKRNMETKSESDLESYFKPTSLDSAEYIDIDSLLENQEMKEKVFRGDLEDEDDDEDEDEDETEDDDEDEVKEIKAEFRPFQTFQDDTATNVCSLCSWKFPAEYTTADAMDHINGHFTQ